MQRLIVLAGEATTDVTPNDPWQIFLQYGVLGAVVVLLILYTRGSITREREKADQVTQRERERADQAMSQVDQLNDYIRSEMLPKQVESSILHKQVAEVLEQAIQIITEMKIRDNVRRQDGHSGEDRRG